MLTAEEGVKMPACYRGGTANALHSTFCPSTKTRSEGSYKFIPNRVNVF